MKDLLLIFFVLLIAIGLGFLIHADPGYAMVSYDQWVIATSIWVAVAGLLIFFFVFYFLLRTTVNIFSIPKRFSRRRRLLNAQRGQKYLTDGIANLIAGNYKKSEKCFLKSAEKNKSYVNYLLAAKAATAQHAIDRSDTYFKKAFLCDNDAAFTISLAQAKLQMQSDQTDAALVAYKSLLQQAPKNPLVLSGLKSIYFKTHQWESLKLILPQLKKQHLITDDEINHMNNR